MLLSCKHRKDYVARTMFLIITFYNKYGLLL